MRYDTSGLHVLDDAECRALLGTVPIGRIVFTDRALPAVQPVNFIVHGGDVVVRTSDGSKLAAAVRNAIVAFEVDDFDAEARTGWSVVAVGRARLVRSGPELAELRALPLQPWAPGVRDRYIRIRPELISGRRIPARRPTGAADPVRGRP